MSVKLNKIYKNADGEYFKAIDQKGVLVLSSPSYPFFFLPEVLEPLEEIGDVSEYEHLIKKSDHNSVFLEGESLTVRVSENGDLEPVDNANAD